MKKAGGRKQAKETQRQRKKKRRKTKKKTRQTPSEILQEGINALKKKKTHYM